MLEELQADARLSQAELGRRVGLSAPAVADRLSRLEREGVIAGYRVEVDPRALGYTLAAVLRMRPAPRQIPAVAEVARATPEVVECHRVTGEDCFYMSGMGGNRVHVFPRLDMVAVITSANVDRRDAHALSDRLLEEQILPPTERRPREDS